MLQSKKYWADALNQSNGIMISQVRSELIDLLDFVSNHGIVNSFLEIGSQDGGTLWSWIQMLELDGHAFSVDLPNGPFGGVDSPSKLGQWRSWLVAKQTLDAVFADSHKDETKAELQKVMAERGVALVDYLFIDGDHSYEGVKSDFEKYSPLVRPGGIVAFHDVAIDRKHPEVGVNKFWTELKAKYPAENIREFVENVDQDWAGIAAVII